MSGGPAEPAKAPGELSGRDRAAPRTGKPAERTAHRAIFITQDADIEVSLFALGQMWRNGMARDTLFLIPVQSDLAAARFRTELPAGIAHRCVRTPHPFGAMLLALAAELGDTPTVFFTLADRYPIKPVAPATFDALADLAATGRWDGVRFCQWKDDIAPDAATHALPCGTTLRDTRPGSLFGSWHPQFLSRAFFDRMMAATRPDMGLRDWQQRVMLPTIRAGARFLVPDDQITVYEEPIVVGQDTLNYALRLPATGRRHAAPDRVRAETVVFTNSGIPKHNKFWTRRPAPEILERRYPGVPVMVQSVGGVGSKMVTRWLYDRPGVVPPPNLATAHGHWRLPPATLTGGQSLVYVFGDPVGSVLSFFQRRQRRHARHGFAAHGDDKALPVDDFALKALENGEAPPGRLTETDGLEEYLAQGLDLFRIEEHVNNHLYGDRPYPILFLRYETLWRHEDVLRDLFPGAPPLPPRVPRAARTDTLAGGTRDALDRLYAGTTARLAALPDVFSVQAGRRTVFA